MEKYINQIVAIDTILGNPPDAHYPVWFAEQIANLPAADVIEVVHGEWLYCPETINLRSHFYCSVCNGVRLEHYTKNNFRYCPNCGAKMDGGKE